jgi:hypothetical protein
MKPAWAALGGTKQHFISEYVSSAFSNVSKYHTLGVMTLEFRAEQLSQKTSPRDQIRAVCIQGTPFASGWTLQNSAGAGLGLGASPRLAGAARLRTDPSVVCGRIRTRLLCRTHHLMLGLNHY